MKNKMAFGCTVDSNISYTKTLPNVANPHIGIYREIGQQVLASIEDGWTHTQTDVVELYIKNFHDVQLGDERPFTCARSCMCERDRGQR